MCIPIKMQHAATLSITMLSVMIPKIECKNFYSYVWHVMGHLRNLPGLSFYIETLTKSNKKPKLRSNGVFKFCFSLNKFINWDIFSGLWPYSFVVILLPSNTKLTNC